MALRKGRECDVFGGNREAKRYRISIVEVDENDAPLGTAIVDKLNDLSQKAVDRLSSGITKSLTAPKKRKKSAAAAS